jgi:hypothetical protein
MGAGKGDDYRRVNKKGFDKNFDAIFGRKDIEEFQKEKQKRDTESHADVA